MDCPNHECNHSILEFARCGCNNTCNCVFEDGVCTTSGGLGTALSKYHIDVVVDDDTVQCGPNGLVATPHIDVLDTDSVDMTITGSGTTADPFVISSDALLQDDGTGPLTGPNLLKLNPGQGVNGLYVSCDDVQDCVGEVVSAVAGDCLEYDTLANSINVVICDESNGVECVPDDGSDPLCPGGGLLVRPSSDANNQLTFGGDQRLYVGPTVVNAIDNAQNIDVTGSGTDTLTFTCVPVPIIGATAQPGPSCLGVTGDTCNGLTITLGLSDDPDQCLICRPDGLFVCCPVSDFDAVSTTDPSVQGPFNGTFAPTPIGPTVCVSVTNPSSCNSMKWTADVDASVRVRAGAGNGDFQVSFEGSFNGGPFGPLSGASGLSNNTSSEGAVFQLRNPGFFSTLAPGGTDTCCYRLTRFGIGAVNAFVQIASLEAHIRGYTA